MIERSRTLGERIVDHRLWRLANRPDAMVAHDADDFRLGLVLGLHVLTDDVLRPGKYVLANVSLTIATARRPGPVESCRTHGL